MYYVYKLNCEDGTYVGMTSNLEKRLKNHRCGNRSSDHPYISHEIMVVTQTKELALHFEDIAIRKYGTLNKIFSGGKSKTPEYYKPRHKAYREAHGEGIRAYMRAFAEMRRDGEMMMFGKTERRLYRTMFKEGRV